VPHRIDEAENSEAVVIRIFFTVLIEDSGYSFLAEWV